MHFKYIYYYYQIWDKYNKILQLLQSYLKQSTKMTVIIFSIYLKRCVHATFYLLNGMTTCDRLIETRAPADNYAQERGVFAAFS